jgi:hypothetical protein
MSIWGRSMSEAVLIRIAFAVEQTVRARKPPALRPSADLGEAIGCGHNCASR